MTAAREPHVIGKPVCDKIAANLVEFGYAGTTGQHIAELLAKPEHERGVVGMMAAEMLADNGITDWKVDYS